MSTMYLAFRWVLPCISKTVMKQYITSRSPHIGLQEALAHTSTFILKTWVRVYIECKCCSSSYLLWNQSERQRKANTSLQRVHTHWPRAYSYLEKWLWSKYILQRAIHSTVFNNAKNICGPSSFWLGVSLPLPCFQIRCSKGKWETCKIRKITKWQ